MQEPIQTSGGEVAVVIYDAPLPPRYLRFSKRFIRLLVVIFPLTLGLLGLGLFIWGLGLRTAEAPRPKIPEVLSERDSKLLALEAELNDLKESHADLTEKLASAPAASSAEDPFLLAIRKPYGMQDLTAQNVVTIDHFTVTQTQNKVDFKFQIINSASEGKVTGNVIVFMISDSVMMAYPPAANAAIPEGIKYSAGETFSVSRLRPTNAEFLHRLAGNKVHFLVYVFSREGDLLLRQKTGPFEVEPKS